VKILFLDIDGVLNHAIGTLTSKMKPFYGKGVIRENAPQLWLSQVKLLNQMFNKDPSIAICISSTWRMHFDLNQIRQMFRLRGFKHFKRIKFITPVVGLRSHHRGEEVARFLQMLKNDERKVTSFVCLDDVVRQFYEDQPFVQTNGTVGLTQYKVNEVLRKLNT